MNKSELNKRFFNWVLSVIKYCDGRNKDLIVSVILKQLIRSSTSTGANYRSACRAKSIADMVYKLKIVEEELDESMYWIELHIAKYGPSQVLSTIHNEANELISIIVASIKTLKKKS